ncbi:DEAD/DEAH box helicase family protein [Myxococcota bacterium]|nr:DEAD/DEAH box helicase family protein [Myxococcota bacterium]MBU1429610.1 DEAD/DEAH box helicase family protein [Myxococcota bacterium]MBU1897416.1 DEAD/DEAH box helicase family protein [Myxococcota bacterium]
MVDLRFHAGTLELRGEVDAAALPSGCLWDERVRLYRAPALLYADVIMALIRAKIPYEDHARAYATLETGLRAHRAPRPFQTEAIEQWRRARMRGLVVLPTGAGKSYVAQLAIDLVKRSALIVVPTLDLVRQWHGLLKLAFARPVGVIGGGEHRVEDLTVTTYDSAYIHMEHIGHRFGLVVFDECHHLPGDAYALAARSCLAPFRLGLTATPERADGRHVELLDLIGPLVYRRDVVEMTGDYLAEYQVEQISVDLTLEEREFYETERAIYRGFVSSQGIRMSKPDGWSQFIALSSRSAEGRRAMQAYQNQRRMAFAAPSKLEYVALLLQHHRQDRALIFTQDNRTAYEVSRRFLLPVITHQTKATERSALLEGLAKGDYTALATSKVLNEGVDVPDANVAIIISGSGSVREHVQRLGRILRKKGDKQAVLYELVSAETTETYTSERRRDHVAYR